MTLLRLYVCLHDLKLLAVLMLLGPGINAASKRSKLPLSDALTVKLLLG